MPPGPSQKGKFKPRKPAKKARAAVPDAQASSSSGDTYKSGDRNTDIHNSQSTNDRTSRSGVDTSFASESRASSSSFSGGRGRGRGRGRGSGRGRGRGLPFFTPVATEKNASTSNVAAAAAPVATEKNASTSNAGAFSSTSSNSKQQTGKRGEASASTSKILIRKKTHEDSEEIVGQLDSAIGSKFGKDVTSAGKASKVDDGYTEELEPPAVRSNMFDDSDGPSRALLPDEYMYDSDSSLEEPKPQPKSEYLAPSILPFPIAPLRSGIGTNIGNGRPKMYANQRRDGTISDRSDGIIDGEVQRNGTEQTRPSPFVDPGDFAAMREEQDSFFLFQLPTRLPNFIPASPNSKKTQSEVDDGYSLQQKHSAKTGLQTLDSSLAARTVTAEVATPPLNSQCFDNTLASAIPGRLGKLMVYKSGKTVLLLQGPDGNSPEIRMNVSEGLTCGFMQEAVVIDPKFGRYVKLGDVHKTAVVAPDLDSAFKN